MISREPVNRDGHVAPDRGAAHASQPYVPPKLEKLRQLAQVTGLQVITGVDIE